MGLSDALEEKYLDLYEYLLTTVTGEWNAGVVVAGESVYFEIGSLAGFVKMRKEEGNGDALGKLLCFWKETNSWAYTFPLKFLEKRKGKQDDKQKNEDKEARLAFVKKKNSLFTRQYGFSLEELLGVIWCLWQQELSCGRSGSNASAGKSGRAQGEESRSLPKLSFLSSRHQAQMVLISVLHHIIPLRDWEVP